MTRRSSPATEGDDTLRGTQGDDALAGLGGDDILVGQAGADTLDGGPLRVPLTRRKGNATRRAVGRPPGRAGLRKARQRERSLDCTVPSSLDVYETCAKLRNRVSQVQEHPGRVIAAMSNITTRQEGGRPDDRAPADEAIPTERSRLEDFIESSVNTFWEIDADLRFTFYSDRDSGDGSAGPSAFVLGRTVLELLGDEVTREPWASHVADLAARRPFRNFCYSMDLSEGVRHLSSSGRPFFDASGAFLGYRGVTHDITELEEARRANAWNANHDALTGLSNRGSADRTGTDMLLAG